MTARNIEGVVAGSLSSSPAMDSPGQDYTLLAWDCITSGDFENAITLWACEQDSFQDSFIVHEAIVLTTSGEVVFRCTRPVDSHEAAAYLGVLAHTLESLEQHELGAVVTTPATV